MEVEWPAAGNNSGSASSPTIVLNSARTGEYVTPTDSQSCVMAAIFSATFGRAAIFYSVDHDPIVATMAVIDRG